MGFCFAVSFYFSCNNKVSICNSVNYRYRVVVATAKVQIFKQITTRVRAMLLICRCCCYRKGTNFQANHNNEKYWSIGFQVVVATAKVQIFKQITTPGATNIAITRCCCYRKGTNFQANHNKDGLGDTRQIVVVATAKVQIFKQITTVVSVSKIRVRCCCYRKDTNFQANHNCY